MRVSWWSGAIVAAGLATWPLPASAGPVLERVSLAGSLGGQNGRGGLETELSWAGSPFRGGGLVWNPLFGTGFAATAWGGRTWAMEKDAFTLLGGVTHYPQTGVGTCAAVGMCPPVTPAPLGAFAGMAYRHTEPYLWLQITPQFYLPLGGRAYFPTWGMSGLPWVELGVPLGEGLEMTLRMGETLATLTYRPGSRRDQP